MECRGVGVVRLNVRRREDSDAGYRIALSIIGGNKAQPILSHCAKNDRIICKHAGIHPLQMSSVYDILPHRQKEQIESADSLSIDPIIGEKA